MGHPDTTPPETQGVHAMQMGFDPCIDQGLSIEPEVVAAMKQKDGDEHGLVAAASPSIEATEGLQMLNGIFRELLRHELIEQAGRRPGQDRQGTERERQQLAIGFAPDINIRSRPYSP